MRTNELMTRLGQLERIIGTHSLGAVSRAAAQIATGGDSAHCPYIRPEHAPMWLDATRGLTVQDYFAPIWPHHMTVYYDATKPVISAET